MHYKKPYDLEDGDVVDMIPVIDKLEGDYDVEVPLSTRSVAEVVYFRVLDQPTPWALHEGKRVDATHNSAFGGVTVYFENGDAWDFPTDLDIPVVDDGD